MGSVKVLLSLLLICNYCQSARILGFFPYSGYSHFVVFQAIMEELVEKGHQVTVLSHFPQRNPPPRYKDISLEGLQPIRKNAVDLAMFETSLPRFLKFYIDYYFLSVMGLSDCEDLLPSDQIRTIMNSKGDYDIVLIEQFSTDCFLPVVNKLEVPIVGISSAGALPWSYVRLGNPTNPAYFSNILTGHSHHMTLFERTETMIANFVLLVSYYYLYERPAELLVEKHLGERVSLTELTKNSSLLLINTHFSLHQPKPHFPGIIEIGGIHVKPAKPLPKELEDFVNGAEHGVIVFSLGSMIDVESMSKEKMSAFVRVFRSLKQRVVWKIATKPDGLSDNVKTVAWLPQRDILAHSNVKAFIAHGGGLGLTEAIVGGKPVIGIPFFGDQPHNIRVAADAGVAVQLDYSTINEESVRSALEAVLSDKYQKRAQQVSKIFLDRPATAKESAVYWVEYVLRHGNEPLRSTAANLTWIEYYMIDSFVLILASLLVIIYVPCKLVCLLVGKKKQKKD